MFSITENARDHRARRAAKRVGLMARKSRWRVNSIDNYGGFQLINERNWIVRGERFDLTAEDVIVWCNQQETA
jgi:hypothetical protein